MVMNKKVIKIFDLEVSTLGLKETVEWVFKNTGTIYCCSLNEVLESDKNKKIKSILEKGNLLTADGMPLVWLMKFKTGRGERVYGPDLMRQFLILNKKNIVKQIFIGGKENEKYFKKFGDYLALPFKDVFNNEDYEKIVREIIKSGAKIVWIGLGAKKQIIMANELNKRLSNRVYITVGAAFDFLSRNKVQCPKIIRNMGGEWLFRWIGEPKRLTERYMSIIKFLFNRIIKLIHQKNTGNSTT